MASAETVLPGLRYEPIRDPERAIRAALLPAKYVKPTWQPRLTERIDLDLARGRSPSLDRFLRKVDELRLLV